MTASAPIEKRAINKDNLHEVTRFGGPFVSLFLSRYAPGAGAGSEQVWLKGALHEIRHNLEGHHFPEDEIAQLLEPIEDLASSDAMPQGHARGEAWFVSPEGMIRLDVGGAAGRGFAVGQHPFLLPLLGALALPSDYYILGLAKHKVTLFRCQSGECVPVPLPATIPVDLEAMLAFDEPDRERDHAATGGAGVGQKRSVRFGTGSEAESADRYVHQFVKLLDQKIAAVMENKAAPVVLAGVRYEIAEFMRVAELLNVVRQGGIEGAWKDLTPAGLLARSAEVLRNRYKAEVAELTSRLRESDRKVENATETLKAALEGRVWRLFVSEDKSPTGWLQTWRDNLELNRAVAESLRRGADVFLASPDQMPDRARIAALLRY